MNEEDPFETLYLPESATLFVFGCVDELAIDAFRSALRSASDDYSKDLLVELSDVEFLPSCAIGVLVGALKASSRARLLLVARPGTIARRVLDICGLPAEDAADISSLPPAPAATKALAPRWV